MAEISEVPNPDLADPPPPPPPPPTAAADLDSTTRTTRPGRKRLLLTLTVLSSFLLGLPFLLRSTEIYRSALPFHSIDSLSAHLRSEPPSLPCRFQAVFLRPANSRPEQLGVLISQEMRRIAGESFPECGTCAGNYTVSVSVESGTACSQSWNGLDGCLWKCGAVGVDRLNGGDEDVDELLEKALMGSGDCSVAGGRVYTVVVVGGEEGELRIVVGKHRHAWVVGKVSEMEAVSMVAKVFVDVFVRGGKGADTEDLGKGEFIPVGSDGSVTLSFSLLNANPNDWVYDWDFHNVGETLLAPVVEALAPLANIWVESQVLYHTPKASFSYWDEKLDSHIFTSGDLPFFVNSKEWHLDTSIASAGRSKVLQFVVYVPSAKECPLRLRLSNKEISMTNGFISPMWGGVIVWNPPTCSMNTHSSHPLKNAISPQDLQKVFQVFTGQLRLLFGLNSDNIHLPEISSFLASERGFTEWELDFLFRRVACFNLLSCATTLESLSKLVQSLPRMIVMDEIGKQVKLSLEAASLAQRNASLGIYDGSAASSRQARALAEDAFFHPSIMSISYSSIEHFFAIYMPFFAPVSLHILLAAIKELKRYKQERRKYLAISAYRAEVS